MSEAKTAALCMLGWVAGMALYAGLKKLVLDWLPKWMESAKEWIRLWRERRPAEKRLRQMERALRLNLSRQQRAMILNDDVPDMNGWPRQSGKTICAVLWLLIHFDWASMDKAMFLQHYYDPDVVITSFSFLGFSCNKAIGNRRLDWAWHNTKSIIRELRDAGVHIGLHLTESEGK